MQLIDHFHQYLATLGQQNEEFWISEQDNARYELQNFFAWLAEHNAITILLTPIPTPSTPPPEISMSTPSPLYPYTPLITLADSIHTLLAERNRLAARVSELEQRPEALHPVFVADPRIPPSQIPPLPADAEGLKRRIEGIFPKWNACAKERDDLKAIFGALAKGLQSIIQQLDQSQWPQGEPETPSRSALLTMMTSAYEQLKALGNLVPVPVVPQQFQDLNQQG